MPTIAPVRVAAACRLGRRLAAVLLVIGTPGVTQAQGARGTIPNSLSDTEFWRLFTSLSEPGGTFVSDNWTSNEVSHTSVIPTLVRTVPVGGVYLGVGPEQNFTYIANLRPSMAIILDIRRDNAMLHLMYKALFELSPTRRDFVGRLFGRTLPATIGTETPVAELMDAALAARSTPSTIAATRNEILTHLSTTHGFPLSRDDRSTIEAIHKAFAVGGPYIHFGYRPDEGRPAVPTGSYPSFALIQKNGNPDGARLTFLASEALYRQVRDLQRRNLVLPVVGDFAGRKALRAIGEYLTSQRATVSAFYVSNVEEYLFGSATTPNSRAGGFYRNLSAVPVSASSMFIRSSRPSYTPEMAAARIQPGMSFSHTRFDSAGVRWTRVVPRPDALNVIAITTSPDSVLTRGRARPRAIVDTVRVAPSGVLVFSGLASIQATLSASTLTVPFTYRDVIVLTNFVRR